MDNAQLVAAIGVLVAAMATVGNWLMKRSDKSDIERTARDNQLMVLVKDCTVAMTAMQQTAAHQVVIAQQQSVVVGDLVVAIRSLVCSRDPENSGMRLLPQAPR